MKQAVINSYALATLSLFSLCSKANSIQDQIQKEYERNFAIGIVLSDSDVFTVGFHDFDPNEYFNIDNEDIGTQDSVDLRKKIAVSTLPFSFDLFEQEGIQTHYLLNGRVYALSTEQDVYVDQKGQIPDKSKELVMGGYIEFAGEKHLTDKLTLSGAIGSHLMYYQNDYSYRSNALNDLKPFLEGVYLNTSAWAVVGEVNTKLKYLEHESWGKWYLWSAPHYFYGTGWGKANNGDIGNPEGWYWVNGIKVFYDFTHIGDTVQSVYSSFNRVDIGGDTRKPMNTVHYYEASVGWLMTPPFDSDWIDNIGIGLTINYGSALKGGSLVLFFNQD
ncbi:MULTISPECIES: Solitary outer membrane autotransporter beta-barrel domain [Vibrio]|uniref:Solitary outer membrane autotransporter-like beta-barrel domain-containing protein n=1 Tax=Vibrio diabolicus TaxID=50719 RepID=A0AAX1XQ45_9VIBR|nr:MULTISPECIES: Solitary outer membrane autotransporter beta-barrel domain [Vibrio]MCS0027106.1 Solitary outer membrane autotransporter beta-barrel domain [Vibrio alginolyticus]RCW21820.1 solitary outer membrane autotransporter-like beta-barrel protein [Vibrio parahaemolyticus]KLE24260.1 hypothetical protein AAW52_11375 [Vibrio diabolicus]MCF7369996.1 Solitary outer membrane autotransporter beta-barrel domain [Vibrio sp. J2-3(2022)]MCG6223345.1 Solitary outer membrane autotransporter beta-bar